MKKLLALLLLFAEIITFIACSPNKKDQEAKSKQDSIAKADSIAKTDSLKKVATITDIDGNIYHAVTIGTQIWMVENLKVTKYNDGKSIPMITDNTKWAKQNTPAYCWYNNDSAKYKNTCGALYNWYTIKTGKLCPKGWHIPNDAEWKILADYLGGENIAGGKMKEAGTTYWKSPNTGATNESGFTALPSGSRFCPIGKFSSDIKDFCEWWSMDGSEMATSSRSIGYKSAKLSKPIGIEDAASPCYGLSVRCIKD